MSTRLHRTLFAAGVLSATLYTVFGPAPAINGGGEMIAIAQNLARTGVFGHPFVLTLDTGPTAVVPPLFPACAGMLIGFLGGSMTWIILACGVILVQGLHVSLLPRLSQMFFGDRTPGVCAAVLCILLPVYSWMPYWDAIYSATGLMLFCLASERMFESGTLRFLPAVLCPVAGGLLALMNPSTLLVSVPWMLFLLRRKSYPLKQTVRLCAIYAVVSILVLLPWSLRNYARFGTFSLRTNLGMTLFASNNDCASSSLLSELGSGCYLAHHPYGSVAEAEMLKNIGEPAYDRDRLAATAAWARFHPTRFAVLTIERVVEFWFPNAGYGLYGRSIGLVTLLSIPGLYLMKRTHYLRFVWAAFLIYPCLYYVVVSDYRYRYPILWLSLLPAGYAVSRALSRVRRSCFPRPIALKSLEVR